MRNLYRNGAEDGLAIGQVEHLAQPRRLPAPVVGEPGQPSCQCQPRSTSALVPLPDHAPADLDRPPADRASALLDRRPGPARPSSPVADLTEARLRPGHHETESHPIDRSYRESGRDEPGPREAGSGPGSGDAAALEPARLRVMEAAARFGAMADAVDEAAADVLAVNRTDLTILKALHRNGHSTAGEAATAAGLSAPATTAAIQRLAVAGLLAREVDPADRRRAVLTLTPTAHERLEQVYGAAGTGPDQLAGYRSEELAVIERFLTDGIAVQQQQACRIRSL